MLFREHNGHRFVVTQPVHAWVSAQLAGNWGNETFGEITPREEVILGAELHDIGWLEWEREPTLNPDTGLPHTFMQLPTGSHLRVWGSASALARPFGRYASLLVSMHGTGLYSLHDYSRDTEEEARSAREYVERELEYQRLVVKELSADASMSHAASAAVIDRNRRLVAVWDAMSLAICGGLTSTRRIRDVPASSAPILVTMNPAYQAVSVDPWPFGVESLAVRFEARRLEGTFAHESDMRQALRDALWDTIEVCVVRAQSAG